MQTCAAAHFRVKAAALREIRQFNISDELERCGKQRKEIQKPRVFGGVLSPISFAVERNGAAGGKYKEVPRAGRRETSLAAGGKRKKRAGQSLVLRGNSAEKREP